MKTAKENDSALHLFGLVSDGGVHSHNTHIYGLLELAKKNGLKKVYVHCFLDGRDTPPASGKALWSSWKKDEGARCGEVASVMGRYYAMDRDNRWDRVERAYNVMTKGEGKQAERPVCAVKDSYAAEKTDEFVEPTAIVKDGQPVGSSGTKILSSSLISVLTGRRSRELSVMRSLQVSQERRDWI